jgi:hypothetical protein
MGAEKCSRRKNEPSVQGQWLGTASERQGEWGRKDCGVLDSLGTYSWWTPSGKGCRIYFRKSGLVVAVGLVTLSGHGQ